MFYYSHRKRYASSSKSGNSPNKYPKKQNRSPSTGPSRNYSRLSPSPSRTSSSFSSRAKLGSTLPLQYNTSLAAELRMLRKAREKKMKQFGHDVNSLDSKTNTPELEVISRSPTPVKPLSMSGDKMDSALKNSPVPQLQPTQTCSFMDLKHGHPLETAASQEDKPAAGGRYRFSADHEREGGNEYEHKPKSSHMSTLPHLPLPAFDPNDGVDLEQSQYR